MLCIDGPQQAAASSPKINHLVEKKISPYLKATYWVRAQTERERERLMVRYGFFPSFVQFDPWKFLESESQRGSHTVE